MKIILEEEQESRGWRYQQLKITGDENMKFKYCEVCGTSYKVEQHHIVFKSECKPLEHCKHNYAYLCGEHHRGDYGPHGKYGKKLNRKLKLEFQSWLEKTFYQDKYTLEEIQKKLDISINATRSLSKLMRIEKGVYISEDIIRACMGGKIY